MTAIIVGLLAALGIGGGFVIANNSGGGGGTSAVVQFTGNKTDYTAQGITPDYNLISALTDINQYEPTIANSDSFVEEYQASALNARLLGSEGDYQGYGNPNDDLRNGEIRGEEIIGTGYYATLNLLKDIGHFYITSLVGTSVDNNSNVQQGLQGILLTYIQDFKPSESVLNRYYTFKRTDNSVYSPNNNIVFKHYNAVHLGGAALGLSVADFGQWEETAWTENQTANSKNLVMHNNKTFFFYDERFAYKGHYYKPTATMQGNVLVSTLVDHQSPDTVYNLQTGRISMDLDLATKTITNGQVVMDNEDYRALYNVNNFTGSIKGSVFIIDGTGWQNIDPEAGALRGGVGKLLIGINGLEMVGNFTKQITYDGEDDDRGKADYTFGAREIN